ncbi:MAG: NAD(P)/FAD-dependent oxidoreductase [Clostridia bacterium]|nr:NAD(P)/FAD-dependent oxidoreductase [Clostridia bacterium]
MPKILIIGGGVAGLSAGIYALKAGYDAVICEKNGVAGGNLTGWQRGGYHIDNCVHWLTGTNPLTKTYKMWKDLGALGGVGIVRPNTLYTYEKDGRTISLCRDVDILRENMLSLSPRDKKETEAFISAVKTARDVFVAPSAPFASLGAPKLLKYALMNTGDLAARFRDPTLQGFISSFLGERFMALALVIVFAHFCGGNADLPKGGSRAMAQRMADKFVSLGGALLLGKEAVKINCANGAARSVAFADGSVEYADHFVLTTEPPVAFGSLLHVGMPKKLRDMYGDARLTRFSSVHAAFSCDVENLPFESDLVFDVPEKFSHLLGAPRVVLRGFPHEKDFSPSGKSIVQAMIFCGEDAAKKFIKISGDPKLYARTKRYFSSVTERLIVDKFPLLRGKIFCIDAWTPATYHRYFGAETGSYMSFAFSAGYIPRYVKNDVPGLKNVILASQWLKAPGGLPTAAESGKRAIETIMKKERRGDVRAASII